MSTSCMFMNLYSLITNHYRWGKQAIIMIITTLIITTITVMIITTWINYPIVEILHLRTQALQLGEMLAGK